MAPRDPEEGDGSPEPEVRRAPWFQRKWVINLLFFGIGALAALVLVDLSFNWLVEERAPAPPPPPSSSKTVAKSDDERAAQPISYKSRDVDAGGHLGRFKDSN